MTARPFPRASLTSSAHTRCRPTSREVDDARFDPLRSGCGRGFREKRQAFFCVFTPVWEVAVGRQLVVASPSRMWMGVDGSHATGP